MWCTLKYLAYILGILAMVGLASFAWQQREERRDRARYERSDSFIEVAQGRRLRVRVVGDGPAPSVIFESGLGATLETWAKTQDHLAPTTKSLAYDRAGIGFSDPGGARRDASTIADELAQLQDAAGLVKPSLLVCHSIGGVYCLVFAARYPERTAGLVLIDPHHPDETLRVSQEAADEDRRLFEVYPGRLAKTTMTGLPRMLDLLGALPKNVGDVTTERALRFSSAHWLGVEAEGREGLHASLEQARAAMRGMPNIPVYALSAQLPAVPHRPIVQSLHRSLVSTEPPGKHLIIEGADHGYIPSAPATLAALVEIVEDVRRSAQRP